MVLGIGPTPWIAPCEPTSMGCLHWLMLINLNRRYSNGNCEEIGQEGHESTCCQAGRFQLAGGRCGSDNPEPASGLAVPDGEQALKSEAPEKPGTSVPGFLLPRHGGLSSCGIRPR